MPKTTAYNKKYIFLVWSWTIVTAPLLMILLPLIISVIKGERIVDTGVFGFIVFSIAFGFILSLPTLAAIYLFFNEFSKRSPAPLTLKLTLIGAGLACIWLTFFIVYGRDAYSLNQNYAPLAFSIAYSTCLIIFSFILSITARTDT